jgi:hypothetical protein
MQEVLEITQDWSVELEIPKCELGIDGCTGEPTHGVRVHDCAFHFACQSCVQSFGNRVKDSFKEYPRMRCSQCLANFRRDRYYRIVKL